LRCGSGQLDISAHNMHGAQGGAIKSMHRNSSVKKPLYQHICQ